MGLLPSVATLSPPSCEPDHWLPSTFADGMYATSSHCFVFEMPSCHPMRTGFRPLCVRGSVRWPAIAYVDEIDCQLDLALAPAAGQSFAPGSALNSSKPRFCLLRVNRALAIQPQRGPLSAVAPISDKPRRSLFVRKVPTTDSCGPDTITLRLATLICNKAARHPDGKVQAGRHQRTPPTFGLGSRCSIEKIAD